jgi:hypothetical protein
MRRFHPSPANLAKRHVFVCLLLTLSFLFNPYLFAIGSDGGLNVRHHASYRATVGSSELEKFSPLAGQDSQVFVAYFFMPVVSSFADTTSRSLFSYDPELLPESRLLWANSWFRPPPAR